MNGRWTRYALLYFLALVAMVVAADNGRLRAARLAHEIPWGDKIGHFVLMGILAFTITAAVRRRHILVANTVLILVVVLEEGSQLWLRYRHFEVLDLVANLAGIIVFARISYLYRASRRTCPSPPGRRVDRESSPTRDRIERLPG